MRCCGVATMLHLGEAMRALSGISGERDSVMGDIDPLPSCDMPGNNLFMHVRIDIQVYMNATKYVPVE